MSNKKSSPIPFHSAMQSMESYYVFLLILCYALSKVTDVEKTEFCAKLTCQSSENNSVCGFRTEGDGFRLKLFENECELLKYGCNVDEENAYGLINSEYCEQSFAGFNKRSDYPKHNEQKLINMLLYKDREGNCKHFHCMQNNMKNVCGIRKDGVGYRVRFFRSKCEMMKHNCEEDLQFTETDSFICESDSISNKDQLSNENILNDKKVIKNIDNVTNLVVVNSNFLGNYSDINDTVDTFFAASHVFDLPMKEVFPLNTRRRLLKYAGPIKVFVPWIVKPENISNDSLSIPTLSSCYHKCPFRCPDTYAPVCGVPGIVAREPSIMFQNHCFMDVAQCKMFWENKSATAHSSSYVEASFLFCMGDEMNAVYRFLPAIRTLQHMGRLKKKGKFRSILRNFRHVSDFRSGRPKFMG